MRFRTLLTAACLTALLAFGLSDARAQVPPHMPGTICFTAQFWCWAIQPGPVGAPCACPTPYGWVAGVLG